MTKKVLVSICIPVKNGLPFLKEVLRQIAIQKVDFEFEIVIVDSGSTDGSLELIQSQNVKLIQIPSHEFNHGSTRNLAIKASQGEFIVMITQDAIPLNDQWLMKLVNPVRHGSPTVAGCFSRHIARANEDPVVELGLIDHFQNIYQSGRSTWSKDAMFQERRGEYIFFSDNSSCLRKAVWEKIPYNHTDMAEDQQWAEAILEAGYEKAYAHDSVIIHSHSYSPSEWLRRSFDEYRSYFKMNLVNTRNLRQTFKNALWLWRNDLRTLKRIKKGPWYKITWAYRRFFISFAVALGQYLGTNFDKMPNSWLSFLSMQTRNIRVNNG